MRGCRVIKLGGSLLNWADLPGTFQAWLHHQPDLQNIVIVGGGELVEAIRRLDEVHSLQSEDSHWLAVQAMSVTAQLAAKLLSAGLVTNLDQIKTTCSDNLVVLDVFRFMQADAKSEQSLPHTWDVTSDSIAARVADQLEAEELVQLKSKVFGTQTQAFAMHTEGLAAIEVVDIYLPKVLPRGVASRCVNLRSAKFDEVRIIGRRETADAPSSA